MQTFVRIVEAGSLSAAAAQMGTTQPTVSRRLQALERSLGRAAAAALHPCDEADRGRRALLRARQGAAGETGRPSRPTCAAPATSPKARCAWWRRMPSASSCWSGRWPTTCAAIRASRSNGCCTTATPDFMAEGIDCAIHVGEVTDPAVVAIKLSEVPRIVVAAPSVLAGARGAHARRRAGRAALAGAAHLLPQRGRRCTHAASGEALRLAIRAAHEHRQPLRPAQRRVAGPGRVRGLGLGADRRPGRRAVWCSSRRSGRRAPLPVYLVYPHARFYPAKLRRFVEAMREAMPTVTGMR